MRFNQQLYPSMGNSQPESQSFSQINWRRVTQATAGVQTYENANDKNMHIEQHHIETMSEEDFDKIKEFSYLRKNNPRWVSALYFEEANGGRSEFCSTKYQADLYLERIPSKLVNLRSIPFPDALHLYDQTLNGYSQFARSLGCFIVQSDYIGINQRGVVKVWAGSRWDQIGVKANSCSEANMVRSVVNCIEEAIDKGSMPPQYPSIGNFLYRSSPQINFETALSEFKNYAIATNMGSIPSRLNIILDTTLFDANQVRRTEQIFESKPLVVSSPAPSQLRYFSPQPFAVSSQGPQPVVQREQLSTEQMESMRRVNSLSNMPVFPQQPRITNHQEIRTIGNSLGVTMTRPAMDRSLSNPQLLSRPQLAPSYSTKQIITIQNQTVPLNMFAPNVSEVRPAVNPNTGSRVNFLRGSGVNSQSEQSKTFAIVKQQQLAIIPPSQTEIPSHPAQPTQISPRREANRGNEPQAQSIIMQLSKSQTNKPPNPTQTLYQNPSNPSPILQGSQSSFKGTPVSQTDNKFFTPIGINKKEISNLNSIEEVQTEHYWKDYSSKNSDSRPEYYKEAEPYSLSNLKQNYKEDTKQLTFNNKYAVINSNDGKSSEDFLQKLKAITTGGFKMENSSTNFDFNKKYDFASSTAQYGFGTNDYISKLNLDYQLPKSTEYNYSFEKKKEFDFSDAFNTESVVKQTSYDGGFGSYEYKPPSSSALYEPAQTTTTDFDEKYTSKYAYGSGSNYNADIDPQLWQDLKKKSVVVV